MENVYLLLLTRKQWVAWAQTEPFSLPEENGLNSYLISSWRVPIEESFSKKYTIPTTQGRHSVVKPERYILGIFNTKRQVLKIGGIFPPKYLSRRRYPGKYLDPVC